MLRCRSRVLLAVVAAAAAAVGALAVACGDDGLTAAPVAEPDAEVLPVAAEICPDAAPGAGEGCALPEGTTCAFGACANPIAACTRGVWRYADNPPPSAACPSPEPPPAGSPCPPCWPASVACDYGACSGPDASTNTAVASCPAGSWSVVVTPCPSDAGPDVQGDGEAQHD